MDKTPEQRRAIESQDPSICVDAGAGSGKTMVLVERIVSLLENERATLSEIVAITYTEKAAAEMKSRLHAAFHEMAPPDDAEKMTFWRDLEHQVGGARIATIHAFCTSLLREHAIALGLDPDFAVLAGPEAQLLHKQVVADGLHALLDADHEAAGRVAVEHGIRSLQESLESALQQRLLFDRIGREHPASDPEALVLHWRELVRTAHEERLLALPGSRTLGRFRARLERFEGVCSDAEDGREMLRHDLLRIIVEMDTLDTSQGIQQALESILALWPHKNINQKNWDSPDTVERLSKLQKEIKSFASEYAPPEFDDDIEGASAALTCDFFAVYEKLAARYDAAKRDRSALDFEDLILLASDAIRTDSTLRKRIGNGIKYLLIDEFQDTDQIQLEMARNLTSALGATGAHLFVVGDAKQSIYDFRGAEVEVFQEAREQSSEIIPLLTNFRSLPNILNFINNLFEGSGLLHGVEKEYAGLTAHRDAVDGPRVEFLVPETGDRPSADETRRREAELIADRLLEMCSGNPGVPVEDKRRSTPRAANFGNVAILFRAASNMHLYETALQRRRIPFQVVGGRGFYERQEIHDFRNLLGIVVDPRDDFALLGFLRSPMGGLRDDAIAALCHANSLSEAFRTSSKLDDPEQQERLERARAIVTELRDGHTLRLSTILRRALDLTGYEAILLTQHHGIQKASNLRKLIELAEDFSRTRRATLRAFVQYLDELASHQIDEGNAPIFPTEGGAVSLITIHKSKGLEFPIVIVADAGRGSKSGSSRNNMELHRRLGLALRVNEADGLPKFPALGIQIDALKKRKDKEEEARVLYVALTRARDWLLIGGGSHKGGNGSWFETLDELYDLDAHQHGSTIKGENWSAVVRRKPSDTEYSLPRREPPRTASMDALFERTRPVPTRPMQKGRISVSRLIDPQDDPERATAAAPGQRQSGDIDPMLRGTLVHQLFESWRMEKKQDAPIERILAEQCLPLGMRERYTRDLNELVERFKRTALYGTLCTQTRIQREVPFSLRSEGIVIEGVIDAVLADGTIIDYKTGRPDSALQLRYEQQLQVYAAAVRRLLNVEPPEAILYYVDLDEQYSVDIAKDPLDRLVAAACATSES